MKWNRVGINFTAICFTVHRFRNSFVFEKKTQLTLNGSQFGSRLSSKKLLPKRNALSADLIQCKALLFGHSNRCECDESNAECELYFIYIM